jgi:hypothetical protein
MALETLKENGSIIIYSECAQCKHFHNLQHDEWSIVNSHGNIQLTYRENLVQDVTSISSSHPKIKQAEKEIWLLGQFHLTCSIHWKKLYVE